MTVMNIHLNDPVILACAGILFLGFLFLVTALRAIFRSSASADDLGFGGDATAERLADFGAERDVMAESLARAARGREAAPPAVSASGAAAVSPDVAARLDAMSQRLVEMQRVLAQQPEAAQGQGFSPETVDKLLKIIGNVIQQVDVLQKSLTK
jgi:hypothetical protein